MDHIFRYYCHLLPSYDCVLVTDDKAEMKELKTKHGALLVVEEYGGQDARR